MNVPSECREWIETVNGDSEQPRKGELSRLCETRLNPSLEKGIPVNISHGNHCRVTGGGHPHLCLSVLLNVGWFAATEVSGVDVGGRSTRWWATTTLPSLVCETDDDNPFIEGGRQDRGVASTAVSIITEIEEQFYERNSNGRPRLRQYPLLVYCHVSYMPMYETTIFL